MQFSKQQSAFTYKQTEQPLFTKQKKLIFLCCIIIYIKVLENIKKPTIKHFKHRKKSSAQIVLAEYRVFYVMVLNPGHTYFYIKILKNVKTTTASSTLNMLTSI